MRRPGSAARRVVTISFWRSAASSDLGHAAPLRDPGGRSPGEADCLPVSECHAAAHGAPRHYPVPNHIPLQLGRGDREDFRRP